MDDDLNAEEVKLLSISDLAFDRKNPRLAEFDVVDNEADIIKVLWDTMDVQELVLSIAASGYFQNEPVIVAEENGRNVVIEGNRRLAAVKLLLEPEIGKVLNAKIPYLSNEHRESLREIPTLLSSRKGAWRYVGFKHVNGPAKWGSYAKSNYIANVHRNYGVPLDDIAKQIGDTHNTVTRLYHGFMVLEQAERAGVYDRSDRWPGHFAFSHLYVGLQYSGISTFLDLRPASDEERSPVPVNKQAELRELLVWLYGSKSEKKPPVIQFHNPHLRQLDAVLANTEALAAMRTGAELSIAFQVSRPSANIFEEALVGTKQNLEKARAALSTGYDHSEALLGVAGVVADLAYDLHEEMERKSTPRRGRRRHKG